MGTMVAWRSRGRCGRRGRRDIRHRTEMVSGSGHGGLGTERLDKINEFLYSFTDKRSKTPVYRFGSDESLPTEFHLYTCPACFISDLDRMGHQLRQGTGHRMSLCDRKLGTQILRNSLVEQLNNLFLSHVPKLPTVKSRYSGLRHNGADGDVNCRQNFS